MRWSTFAVASMFIGACHYGDLSVHGKDCDEAHTCPEGFICVAHPLSKTTYLGKCMRPEDAEPCPAAQFCLQDESSGWDWVVRCGSDGYSVEFTTDCAEQSLSCNVDTGKCAERCTTFDDPACGGGNTCDVGLGLCRPAPLCEASSCDGHCRGDALVCVPNPLNDATVPSPAVPDLGCFQFQPTPLPAPATCTVTGRVNIYPIQRAEDTIGLTVHLRRAGDLTDDGKIATTDVFADPGDKGLYRFDDVPTNAAYDIEVEDGRSTAGVEVVKTVYANLVVRTDAPAYAGGVYTHSLSAMSADTFLSYTSDYIEQPNERRLGLVIGSVTDCSGNPLGNATVGTAVAPIHPGRLYFFADDVILRPDPALVATSPKGDYAAAGIPPCRNYVGFAAKQQATVLFPGLVPFTMPRGGVVIANLQLPEWQLP